MNVYKLELYDATRVRFLTPTPGARFFGFDGATIAYRPALPAMLIADPASGFHNRLVWNDRELADAVAAYISPPHWAETKEGR